jgi:hypothetical protein
MQEQMPHIAICGIWTEKYSKTRLHQTTKPHKTLTNCGRRAKIGQKHGFYGVDLAGRPGAEAHSGARKGSNGPLVYMRRARFCGIP